MSHIVLVKAVLLSSYFFPFGYIFSYWILLISVQLLFWKLRDKHCVKSCQLHTPVEFSIAGLET